MQYFGTDGLRGIANRDLSPELAMRLGIAAGTVFREKELGHSVLIGRDTRQSGPMLLSALAAGFCSAGIHVFDGGVLTTPAVAYLAGRTQGCIGAVVSASHNPAEDNGIKFFSNAGYKLDDPILEAIEEYIDHPPVPDQRPSGRETGWKKAFPDGAQPYVDYLTGQLGVRLDGLRVVVDCANGAASELGPMALRQAGAQVISIHDQPDGRNINLECGSTHLESLQSATPEWSAQAGLAFDGDADRLMAVDHRGNAIDGDQILVILGLHMLQRGELKGPVVTTVMSNLGLRKAFEASGVEVLETQVGDRFVLQEMLEKGASLGGEQSGHLILLRDSTTGDGILSALRLLSVMKETGRSLDDLAGQMQRLPQVLVNATVDTKEGWDTDPDIRKAIGETENALSNRGRLLVRPSGTEALIRVMAEGPDAAELQTMVERLATLITEKQSQRRTG
ncbi:MAG: phosphoglucosamine mutase [Clostridiales bacterium]|nr:phosphoglucosamine mutase [Clostridiales bacterium]